MEKLNIKLMTGAILLMLLSLSCDKTKRASNQFIKKGRWVTTTLTAGTTEYTKLPKWQVYECSNTNDYCEAKWEHPNGSHTNFFWRYFNIGGDFQFYADSSATDTTTMAYAQCKNFMGHYKVMDRKSKSYHFESDEVIGFPGKVVTIKIEAE
jgi:hypothetical protein